MRACAKYMGSKEPWCHTALSRSKVYKILALSTKSCMFNKYKNHPYTNKMNSNLAYLLSMCPAPGWVQGVWHNSIQAPMATLHMGFTDWSHHVNIPVFKSMITRKALMHCNPATLLALKSDSKSGEVNLQSEPCLSFTWVDTAPNPNGLVNTVWAASAKSSMNCKCAPGPVLSIFIFPFHCLLAG